MGEMLFHVTDARLVDGIMNEGLRPLSYWSKSEELSEYYRETVQDDGGQPVVLAIELDQLLDFVGEADLEPDYPGIEEPISGVIGKSEGVVLREWASSARLWRDSLDVVYSLRCKAPIPSSILRMLCENSGDTVPLASHCASRPRPR